MVYLLLKFLHLAAAACFIGGVFFEVMILSRATHALDASSHERFAKALSQRARQVMHWVVLLLFGAGFGLAWHHRDALHAPLASSFGSLLTLKIILAFSILGHFLLFVFLLRRGLVTPQRSRRLHISILLHMLGILLLAKSLFVISW
ncbi:hypothetical protein IB229_06230 [Pseudomonas sp. PDM14]|uniref:hypothetical protein n=1 Tax=Pseudomonas sp. PDM14 TaxID=2769288 RepID=UPI00177A91B3|nr:hypothetical protein [Pseudomonas sp. PDM14]MBD9482557.1 hypothetical protein [Pseudomonas sp. PDM14]